MPRLKTTFTPVVFTWGLQIQLQSSGILYEKLLKIAFLLIIFLKLDLNTFWVTWMTILTSDFRVPFSSYIDNCWPSSPFHFQCQLFNPVFKFKKHCCIWASPYVISSENQHDVVRWTYLWGQKYLSLTLPSQALFSSSIKHKNRQNKNTYSASAEQFWGLSAWFSPSWTKCSTTNVSFLGTPSFLLLWTISIFMAFPVFHFYALLSFCLLIH